MCDYPFEIISASTSVSKPFSYDNSIINARNIDILPPAEIALHAHTYYKIIYVFDCDSFITYIDDCAISFLPNHIYFSPPDTLHSPNNQFSGTISSSGVKFYVNDKLLSDKLGNAPFYVRSDASLDSLFSDIAKISKEKDISKTNLLYSLTSDLISKLCSVKRLPLVSKESGQYDTSFIKVLRYMYANCDREIDLEELANIAHMERTAFAKKFKLLYKITPINYLYSIRLSRSLDLLMSPEISITEIARRIGFKRATAFSSAFVRAFGMTPTEYRDKATMRMFPPYSFKKEIEFI